MESQHPTGRWEKKKNAFAGEVLVDEKRIGAPFALNKRFRATSSSHDGEATLAFIPE